ncbi:MAG: MFS transporter [Acidobacteriales bacterium]|nr:MFS transporter [Terriglobales bacterium]
MRTASQIGWIRELTRPELNTLTATFGGWALDGLDVMVYSFVIPTLITAWRLSKAQAGMLGTVTLLISAIGGGLAGRLADRFGRVRILQITILWFAVFTFLSGFTQSFWQLLITRGLQGLGFGGEWAVGSVLIGESIRAQHRGKAVGCVQAGWAIGWGFAAVLYTMAFSWLPPNFAWRTLFWIGILPALLVFFIRKNVPEPVVSAPVRDPRMLGGFLGIFSPVLLRTTILCSLLALGVQGGYYAITTWLPTYLKTEKGLSVLDTGGYLAVIIAGSFAGYVCAAYLSDLLGRKPTLVLFAVGASITVMAYTFLNIGNSGTLALGMPLGFFSSGAFSPVGAFYTELFPRRLRGTGQGFTYNLGRAAGALFPALVGFLTASMPLGHAIAIFAAGAYLVMMAATLLLPETKGIQLRA